MLFVNFIIEIEVRKLDFGTRLKQLRSEHKLTQDELGKKINVSKASISLYEKNQREPSKESLITLANFFNVSTDYLLGNSDKRKYYDLTDKDREDIGVQVDRMLAGLSSDSETNYYGEPMTREDKEKMRVAMVAALEAAQIEAKRKFTPKKYRNDKE